MLDLFDELKLIIERLESERIPYALCGGLAVSVLADPAGDILSVDMLLVTEATQDAWNTRQELTWESGRLVTVSKDGLILLKRLRGSKQDEADIERLTRE